MISHTRATLLSLAQHWHMPTALINPHRIIPAGTNLMVGLAHTWEPLAKLPALESVELR